MARELVVQIALDIATTENDEGLRELDEKKVAQDLESLGYTVVGSAWKATWSKESYEKGQGPESWD